MYNIYIYIYIYIYMYTYTFTHVLDPRLCCAGAAGNLESVQQLVKAPLIVIIVLYNSKYFL